MLVSVLPEHQTEVLVGERLQPRAGSRRRRQTRRRLRRRGAQRVGRAEQIKRQLQGRAFLEERREVQRGRVRVFGSGRRVRRRRVFTERLGREKRVRVPRARRHRVQDASGHRRDVSRVARRAPAQALALLRGLRGPGLDEGRGASAHARGPGLGALVPAEGADGRLLGDVDGLVHLHRRGRRRRISPPAVLGQLDPRRLLADGALHRVRGRREPALEEHVARVLLRARVDRGLVHRLFAKVSARDEQIHDRPDDLGAVRLLLGAGVARVPRPPPPRLHVPQPPADGPEEQVPAAARLVENQIGALALLGRGGRGRASPAARPEPRSIHVFVGHFSFAPRVHLHLEREVVFSFVHLGGALAEVLHPKAKRARGVGDAHASLASQRAQRHEAILRARFQLHPVPTHGFQEGRREARLVGGVERVIRAPRRRRASRRRRDGRGHRRRQTQRVHLLDLLLVFLFVRHGRDRRRARGVAPLDEPRARAREQLVHLVPVARVLFGPPERAARAPERPDEHAHELFVRHQALRRVRALERFKQSPAQDVELAFGDHARLPRRRRRRRRVRRREAREVHHGGARASVLVSVLDVRVALPDEPGSHHAVHVVVRILGVRQRREPLLCTQFAELGKRDAAARRVARRVRRRELQDELVLLPRRLPRGGVAQPQRHVPHGKRRDQSQRLFFCFSLSARLGGGAGPAVSNTAHFWVSDERARTRGKRAED